MAQYCYRSTKFGEIHLKSITSRLALASIVAGTLLIQVGCTDSAEETVADNPALTAPVPAGMVRGTVLETMDSGGYTYVLLETDQDTRWAATQRTAVDVGDIVQVDEGMSMADFTSNTLNRTFDVVYFTGALTNLSKVTMPAGHPETALPQGHPDTGGAAQPAAVEATVAPLESGQDIASVYANKDSLAGKQVSLRGKVVKYNEGILGQNFIHLQDGSGDAGSGTNDITVTSQAMTAVGDTIVVTGTIVLDKDFGAGYSFPVLLADASIAAK
jgi:hypothetical protein